MNFVLEMIVKLLATESLVQTYKPPVFSAYSSYSSFSFMENNHSLPSTFDPTIASWPKTDKSSPHPYKFKIRFNIHFSYMT